MPDITLNDGNSIPMLAFGSGTAVLKGKRSRSSDIDQPTVDVVKTAISVGYRHLDNAELYGTEAEVGIAIKESIEEGVITDRKELFVTTKVAKDPLNAEKAIDQSLEKLQLGYVDLFLIHSPYFAKSDFELQQAWAALERIRASGKARSIGVSNYEVEHLKATLATAKTPPAINQIEYHPYMTKRNGLDLLTELRVDGVAVSAYGALAPVTSNLPGPLDGVLERLASIYDVSPGVICLRWCIKQNVVVITTSQKEERMREYFELFSGELTEEDVQEVSSAGEACLPGGKELKARVAKYLESIT